MYKYQMKITEIISENKTDEGALSSALGYMFNPVTTGSMVKATNAAKAAKDALPFKNAKQAIKYGEKAAKSVRKATPFAKKGGWLEQTLSKYFTGRNLKKLEMAKAEVGRDALKIFGDGIFKLFWAMNIASAVIDYYAAKKVLEENPPADFDAQMNKLRGTFIAQILVPGIAMGGMKLAGALASILPGFLKLMPGKTLPRLGILTNVAIDIIVRVGAAGIVGYIMSDEGKQALADWLGGIIDGAGWASSAFFTLIEGLVAFVEVASGKQAPDWLKRAVAQPKPQGQPASGQPTPGQSGQPAPGPASGGSAAPASGGVGFGGSFDDLAADLFVNSMNKSNQR
jgi:hypothetical protein